MKKVVFAFMFLSSLIMAEEADGEKVFQKYCWGCHHQTSMAFGPPFSQIAKKRTQAQIIAYIQSPKKLYKSFGYKRSVMTQFHLDKEELQSISKYILSFKGKK
jgi:mono/diheme cytochrome c family protein